MISPKALCKELKYDAETGKLFWLNNRGARGKQGAEAFSRVNNNGYNAGKIFGKSLLAHRVIWAIVHGEWPEQIDHINGNRLDNRLCNLRDVSIVENARNKKVRVTTSSGVQGVGWHKSKEKWEARITWAGKTEQLGAHVCLAQAVKARKLAEARYSFHSNHGRLA